MTHKLITAATARHAQPYRNGTPRVQQKRTTARDDGATRHTKPPTALRHAGGYGHIDIWYL